MIFWQGRGLLIILFAMGGYQLGLSLHSSGVFAFWGVAAAIWVFAMTVGKTTQKVLLDPATQAPVVLKTSHSLYFLPPVFWAVVSTIVAIAMSLITLFVKPLHPDTSRDIVMKRPQKSASATKSPAVSKSANSVPPAPSAAATTGPATVSATPAVAPAPTPTTPVPAAAASAPTVANTLPTSVRDWKSDDGRPLHASLVRFIDEARTTAEFRRDDGQTFQIPVGRFSPEDEAFIHSLPAH